MKARVKAQDHINLDAVGIGTASIIVRALKLLVEYEAGNEVTRGLGMTAVSEIEAAIEEAEAMKDGVIKELRKKRRDEVKGEAKAVKTDIGELFASKDPLDQDMAEAAMEAIAQKAENDYMEGSLDNQACARNEDHCG